MALPPTLGASCYAGWGLWTPDDPGFVECVPLLGEEQGSDKAEVRALVAALEKTEDVIEVITDNQYVRGTAQYLATGGMVHKGQHSDPWGRIKLHICKLGNIIWVRAHLKEEKASAAGLNYDDWFGNRQAHEKAKEGTEMHGYTPGHTINFNENVTLAQRVQQSHAEDLQEVYAFKLQ
eukprot:6099240-Heterocapsa_arctica.AAC.1